MTLNNAEFIAALELISLVPVRGGILSSEYIRGSVDGASLLLDLASDIVGHAEVKRDPDPDFKDEIFVDRSAISAFANANKGGKDFVLTTKGTEIVFKCGPRIARFTNQADRVTGYGARTPNSIKVDLTDQQRSLIGLAANYATEDPSKNHLNCVYCAHDNGIYATDEISLFYAPAKDLPFTFPIPVGISRMLAENTSKTCVSKSHFELVSKNGWIQQPVSTAAQTKYPLVALSKYFDAKLSVKARFATDSLEAALLRLKQYVSGSIKRDLMVEISGAAGDSRARLKVSGPSGVFKETCAVDVINPDFKCVLPLLPLLPFVAYTKAQGNKVVSVSWDDAANTPHDMVHTKTAKLVIARLAL